MLELPGVREGGRRDSPFTAVVDPHVIQASKFQRLGVVPHCFFLSSTTAYEPVSVISFVSSTKVVILLADFVSFNPFMSRFT